MSTPPAVPEFNGALAPGKRPASQPQRIRVVDDDQHIRQLCSAVLIHSGYRMDTADDGDAGWQLLLAKRFDAGSHDLLITDNNMPKLSGLELVKKLRDAHMNLPVILASGTAPVNKEWLDAAESLQLAAILPKPYGKT